jgi:8-oxo-dGTP pyrophosphatase MutT (NUDIX family)
MHKAEPSEELLQCYDEAGNPTDVKTRGEIKKNPGKYWCGVTNIWFVNDNTELLCSKRSEGLSGNPGKWQTYFGGHVPAGMGFRETALKELEEEVGLRFKDQDLFLVHRGRDDVNKKFFESYAVRFNGQPSDLSFTDGEVTEAKWMTLNEYVADQAQHPELWCNGCRPERQEVIREWAKTFQK